MSLSSVSKNVKNEVIRRQIILFSSRVVLTCHTVAKNEIFEKYVFRYGDFLYSFEEK